MVAAFGLNESDSVKILVGGANLKRRRRRKRGEEKGWFGLVFVVKGKEG